MFLPKLREVKEALSSLFSAPYTTRFPKEAFEPAEQFRGFPKYHEDYCVGCGACAQVCPPAAITMTDDVEHKTRRLTVNYASCIHCGQCEEKCMTEQGIQLSTQYSLSGTDLEAEDMFEHVDKELLLCELCGEVIAARDHLLWLKDRLGAKAYAHPNLLLETQKAFADLPRADAKARIRREDQFKQVCPRCRHKTVVADEF
ncbi:MAG: 4Fe-4S dicluster domain-containing protein [candidate division KSB1 bacterium]|nr:4Fe-4S dicluster domain-containing protein [candidate division KSB1 bacterium]